MRLIIITEQYQAPVFEVIYKYHILFRQRIIPAHNNLHWFLGYDMGLAAIEISGRQKNKADITVAGLYVI